MSWATGPDMHAGLTEIVLDRGTLSFMWHRPGEPMGQLQRRLSDDQIGQFHRWVGRNNLYMLDSEYPPPPDTGEGDRAMLTVRVRGVEQTIRWTDRSQIPDTLQVAVGELELFAKGLRTRQTESPRGIVKSCV